MAQIINPSDEILQATSPRLITVTLANNLLFEGNVTGTVNNVSVTDITGAITNFNNSNDQKNTSISAPAASTPTHVLNDDGSANVTFTWTWSGTEADIDGFIIVIASNTGAGSYTIGSNAGIEAAYVIPASKRAYITYGVNAVRYYTFGVRAYRRVSTNINSSGIIVSNISQNSTGFQPSTSIAVTVGSLNGSGITSYQNSQVNLNVDAANGNISLGNAGTGSISGVLNPSRKLTGTNVSSYIDAGAIGETYIGNLSANKITTGTLNAGVVNVTNLNASNITTGTLNAGVISVTNLNASNITSGTLNAGVINVTNLNASNITSGTINAGVISVTNLNANNITAGTIGADKISVTSLSAISANLGTMNAGIINSGMVNTGSFTGYAWPGGGGLGAHIGPAGILAGNAFTAGYFQFDSGTGFFQVGRVGGQSISLGGNGVFTVNGDIIATGNIKTENVTTPRANSGTFSGAWGPGVDLPCIAGVRVLVWATWQQGGSDYGREIRFSSGGYFGSSQAFTANAPAVQVGMNQSSGGSGKDTFIIYTPIYTPGLISTAISIIPTWDGTIYIQLVGYGDPPMGYISAMQGRR